ncbi:UNVERIFIED_CONTAM: hypothetical protein GTU68_062851 [Idotea baltica]|nr:hypothetical protein [Idotea baltica]
MPNPTQNLQK